MLGVGDFLPPPLLPQVRWLLKENHLETLTYNPSIWKVQSLMPEKVQNELVTRAEEGGGGWRGVFKWTEFPEFSGVQELNLPHKTNKCSRGWPGMGHLEWFWQRNLCARCRSPSQQQIGCEEGKLGSHILLSVTLSRPLQLPMWFSDKRISLPMQKTQVPSLGWEDFPGVGNDNPLQSPCLENPLNRGTWQATVPRVAKSQTRLSDWADSVPP